MTEEQINVTQSGQQKPGFFRRFLKALVKTVLALVIIAALAAAGWFIYEELTRSFDVVSGRVDRQVEQASSLQEQLDAQAEQLEAVRSTVSGLDEGLAGNLAELQVVVGDNKSQQDENLAGLTDQVAGLTTGAQSMNESIALLSEGQAVLQQDVIGLSSDLDAQGGEFDKLLGEFKVVQENESALTDNVAAFEAELALADPAALRQAVLVFRLWEMVARARLRLVEHNLGLAADDVQLSLAALSVVKAGSPEEMIEPLQQVEERLLMAADNLPDTPATAANDLDIAWQDLDAILSAILGIEAAPAPTPES